MFCDAISWLAFNHRPSDTMTSTASDLLLACEKSHFMPFLLAGLPCYVTQHNLKYSLWEFDHPVWSAEIKDHLRQSETRQMTPFRCPTVEAISQLLNYDAFFSASWYANCAICRRKPDVASQTNPFILHFILLRSSIQMWFIRRWWREIAYH